MSSAFKQLLLVALVVGGVLTAIVVVAIRGANNSPLRVDVLSARRAEPGEALTVTVSARSAKGCPRSVEVDFGDGTDPVTRAVRTPDCETPIAQSFDFPKTFDTTGLYTVEATVRTTAGELDTAVRTINVKPLRAA